MLSAGPDTLMRANVPEVMFNRVTKPIQIEHYSKKSTDTELKSFVGLTAFYCQLASRSHVLAMCLKLKKFKLDLIRLRHLLAGQVLQGQWYGRNKGELAPKR